MPDRTLCLALAALLLASSDVFAQAEDTEARLRQLEQTVEELKATVEPAPEARAGGPEAEELDGDERAAEVDAAIDEIEQELLAVRDEAESARRGTTAFLLTGNAKLDYTDRQGENPSFAGILSPHLLWRLGSRGLFEGHLDLELRNSETHVDLEFANFSYLLNDHLTFVAGKFLSPFGYFQERIHTAWINKLPDEPLAVSDHGLAPTANLGVQLRGVVSAGPTRFNYALYLANGPRLNLGTDDPRDAGKLEFDNYTDLNHNKAIGGRLGFLPIADLEIGYSFLGASVAPKGSGLGHVDAILHGADLSYVTTIEALKGRLAVYAEWIWSDVDDVDYGAGVFDNKRQGGYVQLSFRPSLLENDFLSRLEAVARYGLLDMPSGAPVFDQHRWTFGGIYRLTPAIGIKAAYQMTTENLPGPGDDRDDAVLLQLFVGF